MVFRIRIIDVSIINGSCPQGRAGGDIGGHRGGKERQIRLDTETTEVPAGRDGVRGERKFVGGAGGFARGGGEGGEAVEGAVRPSEAGRGRLGFAERLRRVHARDREQQHCGSGAGEHQRPRDSPQLGKGLA